MPESIVGGKGLYISFKKEDGSWTQAKNIKPTINTNGSLATLSPDGKYLFYNCNLDQNIYWLDAKIIEDLKPKEPVKSFKNLTIVSIILSFKI